MPQITITGDVNLIGWEGRRISVWENYDVPGYTKPFSRLWTCWFDFSQAEHLQEGDWIELTGELSTKIGKYFPKDSDVEKTVVEHHLQTAQLVQARSKTQQGATMAQVSGFENAPF
jgi:hypothetical protein